jgi:hypothetical protein
MKADLAAPSTLLCHSPPVIIANRDPVFHRNEIEDTQSSGLVGIVEADEPQTSQIDVLRRTIEAGVSSEWGDYETGGTVGRVECRLGERGCDGCCG